MSTFLTIAFPSRGKEIVLDRLNLDGELEECQTVKQKEELYRNITEELIGNNWETIIMAGQMPVIYVQIESPFDWESLDENGNEIHGYFQ